MLHDVLQCGTEVGKAAPEGDGEDEDKSATVAGEEEVESVGSHGVVSFAA